MIRAASLLIAAAVALNPGSPSQRAASTSSCFLLHEMGVGEVRRDPAQACTTRVTPASTFKVPHALAALDAGVVRPDEVFKYDGAGQGPESSRRDHTLATAIRHSVLWYFQQIAGRLGPERERAYLERFNYGNKDSSSALTSFWVGGSLKISPAEQLAFWVKLYENKLPVSSLAASQVKQMLVQPNGVVTNAAGEQPFDSPWPPDTQVSSKTGSAADQSGRGVRWLAGHVQRGNRSYVFVSCVTGPRDVDPNAAIAPAARSLRTAGVLPGR